MKQLLICQLTAICLLILAAAGPAAGSAGDDGAVTIAEPESALYSIGDTLTFSGMNTASGTTYLFITGPNLVAGGSQVQSTHPRDSPVIDGDASTFRSAIASAGNTWLWTWDTQNVFIDSGMYTLYAVSRPRDLDHINETQYARVSFIMKKPVNASADSAERSSEKYLADPGYDGAVTITRPESRTGRYFLGDTITFSGTNTISGTTYLFITGSSLDTERLQDQIRLPLTAPRTGSQIQSLHPRDSPVADGDVSTFSAARVGPDTTWSYTWDTRDVDLDTGTYAVFAVSTPRDLAHIGSSHYAWVTFNMMRPADIYPPGGGNISIPSVVKEDGRFTVSGIARADPHPGIGIWVIIPPDSGMPGYVDQMIENPDSTGFYSLGHTDTRLKAGKYHVLVQYPGKNSVPDIYLVRNFTGNAMGDEARVWNRFLKEDNDPEGTKLFKVMGPESLQGDDAYKALIAAFSDPGVDDIITCENLPESGRNNCFR